MFMADTFYMVAQRSAASGRDESDRRELHENYKSEHLLNCTRRCTRLVKQFFFYFQIDNAAARS
jgi:hypothetical protein